MIAYVMLSPELNPRLASAPWRTVINARIWLLQMRGKRGLITEKPRVSHGQAVFSLPSPFDCNHQEHVDTLFYLLTSNRTRSNALRMCYQSRVFFCFLWFEGHARRLMMHDGILHEERTALLAWRAGRTDCRDWKGGETAGEKSRKDNKGEGVSCQCPLRKSPPSGSRTALLNYTCLFSRFSSFSYNVQIKLHLSSVSQKEWVHLKHPNAQKGGFFLLSLTSGQTLSWFMTHGLVDSVSYCPDVPAYLLWRQTSVRSPTRDRYCIITTNRNIFSLDCNSAESFVGWCCIQAVGSAWKSRRCKADV